MKHAAAYYALLPLVFFGVPQRYAGERCCSCHPCRSPAIALAATCLVALTVVSFLVMGETYVAWGCDGDQEWNIYVNKTMTCAQRGIPLSQYPPPANIVALVVIVVAAGSLFCLLLIYAVLNGPATIRYRNAWERSFRAVAPLRAYYAARALDGTDRVFSPLAKSTHGAMELSHEALMSDSDDADKHVAMPAIADEPRSKLMAYSALVATGWWLGGDCIYMFGAFDLAPHRSWMMSVALTLAAFCVWTAAPVITEPWVIGTLVSLGAAQLTLLVVRAVVLPRAVRALNHAHDAHFASLATPLDGGDDDDGDADEKADPSFPDTDDDVARTLARRLDVDMRTVLSAHVHLVTMQKQAHLNVAERGGVSPGVVALLAIFLNCCGVLRVYTYSRPCACSLRTNVVIPPACASVALALFAAWRATSLEALFWAAIGVCGVLGAVVICDGVFGVRYAHAHPLVPRRTRDGTHDTDGDDDMRLLDGGAPRDEHDDASHAADTDEQADASGDAVVARAAAALPAYARSTRFGESESRRAVLQRLESALRGADSRVHAWHGMAVDFAMDKEMRIVLKRSLESNDPVCVAVDRAVGTFDEHATNATAHGDVRAHLHHALEDTDLPADVHEAVVDEGARHATFGMFDAVLGAVARAVAVPAN